MSRLPVTLQDIAARTGVSKVTVSYVLNGRETRVRISDSTRQRVLTAAREMGYSPNGIARALARRRTDTITLVMQSPNVFAGGSGFISSLMHGVLEAANALGYDVLVHTKTLSTVDAEVAALSDGRADGLLLLRDRDDPLVTELQARSVPCVSIFARLTQPDTCYVDCDNVMGARLAVEHLYQLGHRCIGWVGGNLASASVQDRAKGYADTLAQFNLPFKPEYTCTIPFEKDDPAALVEMMQRSDAPSALFVWSDDVALAVIATLRDRLGLRVPEDVSVIGFDGTEGLCERSVPRLTSIRQPIYDIAAQAVRLLAHQIRSESHECEGLERQVLLSPRLTVRDSCASPSLSLEPSERTQ